MLKHMPLALAALVGIVAWGGGGYDPWAMFVLEVSAVVFSGVVVVSVLFGTSSEERVRNASIARSRRWHPFGKRASADVEITPPAGLADDTGRTSAKDRGPTIEPYYVLGYAFRRTGAGILALAITIWMTLSLVPLRASWLALLSPTALAFRNEVAMLVGVDSIDSAPWSVTPFLSFQDVLLWLAYLMLFWVTFHVAASPRAVRRLTVAILLVGIASGAYGLAQWLATIGASLNPGVGHASPVAGYVTTGTFGNRNHFAFFQEMALLIGLGWLLSHWRAAERRARDRVARQEAHARTGLFAVGVGCIALSLLFSLSRSGITFAMAATAALFFLTRTGRSEPRATMQSARPIVTGLVLCLVAATLWIGIDPIVSRFELVPSELRVDEQGRAAVWRDSIGAVGDFWLTGSGLSSFQYVYPIYRTFGGRRFYSWAHNDYLQVAIELGLPGLLLVAIIIMWVARKAHAVRGRLSDNSGWAGLHAGYCAAAIAVGLHSFTDFGLRLPANAALLAIILAVVTGMTPERRSHGSKRKVRKKKLRRSAPAVV